MAQDPQLVRQGHRIFQILQVHPVGLRHLLRQMCQLTFFQELARGDDGFKTGGEHGAFQAVGTRGVVEHRRDTVAQRGAKNRRGGNGGIRQ
ncbi:hypothetical protein D3C72_2119620 [compost metagenome]